MKSLLIADDHLMIGSSMKYLLQQLDPEIQTVAVGSAVDAMKQLGEHGAFDLILLDYDMPGTNGIQGMIKIHEIYPDQIVGIISGKTDPHLVKSAIESGAVGWLAKSMSEEPLLHALRMMAAGGQFVPTDVLAELKEFENRWGDLSSMETQVAGFLLEGLSNKEIATKLNLATRTVENHVRAILKKADVDNRTKFALAFQKMG